MSAFDRRLIAVQVHPCVEQICIDEMHTSCIQWLYTYTPFLYVVVAHRYVTVLFEKALVSNMLRQLCAGIKSCSNMKNDPSALNVDSTRQHNGTFSATFSAKCQASLLPIMADAYLQINMGVISYRLLKLVRKNNQVFHFSHNFLVRNKIQNFINVMAANSVVLF